MASKGDNTSLDLIPDVVVDPTGSDYLEVMARAGFQAGLSWAAIAKNWERYREALDWFDVERVAAFDALDVGRIMETEGVLHSRRKIEAVIANARALLEVKREFGSVAAYVASFGDFAAASKDIRRRFTFMGEMNVWYWLFRCGAPVPRFEDWVKTIPGDHPRMKEMVEKARDAGTSREY